VKRFVLAGTLVLGLGMPAAQARDYGQAGTIFPIVEPDLLVQIRAKLTHLEQTGETARLNAELKRRAIARVNRPTPVDGLQLASTERRWTFDPTITLDADVTDDKGRIILAKGMRVNPLDTVLLRHKLVFLDADDPAQLDWALASFRANDAKLILVAGAPLELMKAKQRRFYFDQGGSLMAHFGIRAVPAIVEQQGRLLGIREHVLPKKQTRGS
jgi:conjugal transfer pilus assembly protein TraW